MSNQGSSSSSEQDEICSVSSLGSSIIVLPTLSGHELLNPTRAPPREPAGDEPPGVTRPVDEVSLRNGSDSELLPRSSPRSSIIVIPEDPTNSHCGSLTEQGNALTARWLASSPTLLAPKRRRVHSDPTPFNIHLQDENYMSLSQAGLRQPAPLDQLNDLVGIVQVGGWGSEIGSSVSEVAIPSWDVTQGSVGGASTSQTYSLNEGASGSCPYSLNELHGVQETVGPSSHDLGSSYHGRTTYTDAVLEMVFKDFLANNVAYNDKVDELRCNVEEMSYSLARLVEENHYMQGLQGRIYLLEWDIDNQQQAELSDRILIINVPTKLSEDKLRELVVRVAHRVGVFLHKDDIADIYYLFRKPSVSSPVLVVFMAHALSARRKILLRKHRLQNIPLRTLQGFGRYSARICVDEQLIGKRNELKQAAKRVLRQGRLMDTWVREGNVYVRDLYNCKHVVESGEALDRILEQHY